MTGTIFYYKLFNFIKFRFFFFQLVVTGGLLLDLKAAHASFPEVQALS